MIRVLVERMDESDEEFDLHEEMNEDIVDCEGLLRSQWNMKCVTLFNEDGLLDDEGTCHSVNSDLMIRVDSPLGDTHVAVFISKSHSDLDISREHIYSLNAMSSKLCCRRNCVQPFPKEKI